MDFIDAYKLREVVYIFHKFWVLRDLVLELDFPGRAVEATPPKSCEC